MSTNGRARWKQRYYDVEQILGSRVATAEDVAEAECGSVGETQYKERHAVLILSCSVLVLILFSCADQVAWMGCKA
jgi:hypothetical protein